MEQMIKLQGLRKSFGSTEVLRDISFTLDKGSVLSIIGPSGSGKSTTLRIITQLERADDGLLEIAGHTLFSSEGGRAVYARPDEERLIGLKTGLVFQSFNLFPHFTVLRNITEAQRAVLKRPREEAEAKAIEDQNREVEAFDSLSDDLRAFLCDLYFTGKMSREVPLDDPGIQTLLSQGFVSYARAGMVSAHPRYGRAVMVTLSKRSLRLFKNNESAMRRVYIGLVGLIS